MAAYDLDFGRLLNIPVNNQNASVLSDIGNIAGVFGKFANEAKAEKQLLYGQIEESKRKANDFTSNVVREKIQSYADNINKENVELLKRKYFLTPQDKAKIQSNLERIDEFSTQLKGFEQSAKQAYNEYNTSKGMMMYEDPNPYYEQVLKSLEPDKETGTINESAVREAITAFNNGDSGKGGLFLREQNPDNFLNSYLNAWKSKNKLEDKTIQELETITDPKVGLMRRTKTSIPIDYNGFDDAVIYDLASDEQGRGAFKYVSKILTDEEKSLANQKYAKKDEFGRPVDNPMIPLMKYYMIDKMGIKNKMTDDVSYSGLVEVDADKNKEKEDKYAPKDTNPKEYVFSNFKVTNAITNPDAKKKPYAIKGVRKIDRSGNLGNPSDAAFEVANDRVVSVSKDDGSMVLARDVNNNGTTITEYRWAPLKGNEQMVKEYLGEVEYKNLLNEKIDPLSAKELNNWFKSSLTKSKSDKIPVKTLLKNALDNKEILIDEYQQMLKLLDKSSDKGYTGELGMDIKLGE